MHRDCAGCQMIASDNADPASLTLEINRNMLTIVTLGDRVPQRLQQVIDYAKVLRDDWGEDHPDKAMDVEDVD